MKHPVKILISFNESTIEVPQSELSNFEEISFETYLESGSFYRKRFNGQFDISGSTYKAILELNKRCCTKLKVTFKRSCDDKVEFIGFTTTRKLYYDLTKCKITVKSITLDDPYTVLNSNKNKKINLLGAETSLLRSFNWGSDGENSSQLITGGIWLNQVFSYLLKNTLAGTTFENNFPSAYQFSLFYNSVKSQLVPSRNNEVNNIIFLDGYSFVYPNATEKSTVFEISYEDFFNSISSLHNVVTYYDFEEELFKVEHITFFPQESYDKSKRKTINLNVEPYLSLNNDNKQYYYREDEIQSEHTLEITSNTPLFKDSFTGDYNPLGSGFSRGRISFDEAGCVTIAEDGTKEKKEISANLVVTYIQEVKIYDTITSNNMTLDEFQSIINIDPNTNFILVALDETGKVLSSFSDMTLTKKPNVSLAADYCMREYRSYLLPFPVGTYNFYEKVSKSKIVRLSRSTSALLKIDKFIALDKCENFDPTDNYITWLSNDCQIEKAVKFPFKKSITFSFICYDECKFELLPDSIQDPSQICPPAGQLIDFKIEQECYVTPFLGTICIPTFKGVYTDGNCGTIIK